MRRDNKANEVVQSAINSLYERMKTENDGTINRLAERVDAEDTGNVFALKLSKMLPASQGIMKKFLATF